MSTATWEEWWADMQVFTDYREHLTKVRRWYELQEKSAERGEQASIKVGQCDCTVCALYL